MEERQTQIREQAGLTESRLSEDFIEVLRKYSSPALLILALVAGGFWAYRKYEQMHRDSQNLAYRDLELAGAAPTPAPMRWWRSPSSTRSSRRSVLWPD